MSDTKENKVEYIVVKNHEDQYSIWPLHRSLPLGWEAQDFQGEKNECLDYIGDVWVDMRPLSLRQAVFDQKN